MSTLPSPHFLTVAEIAAIMRVSPMTVYRRIHSGALPAVQFGHQYRVSEAVVLHAMRVVAAPEPPEPGDTPDIGETTAGMG